MSSEILGLGLDTFWWVSVSTSSKFLSLNESRSRHWDSGEKSLGLVSTLRLRGKKSRSRLDIETKKKKSRSRLDIETQKKKVSVSSRHWDSLWVSSGSPLMIMQIFFKEGCWLIVWIYEICDSSSSYQQPSLWNLNLFKYCILLIRVFNHLKPCWPIPGLVFLNSLYPEAQQQP